MAFGVTVGQINKVSLIRLAPHMLLQYKTEQNSPTWLKMLGASTMLLRMQRDQGERKKNVST